MIDVLDEKVIHQSGCFKRVVRYLRGVHPSRGYIVHGITGLETVEEKDIIIPMNVFVVGDKSGDNEK